VHRRTTAILVNEYQKIPRRYIFSDGSSSGLLAADEGEAGYTSDWRKNRWRIRPRDEGVVVHYLGFSDFFALRERVVVMSTIHLPVTGSLCIPPLWLTSSVTSPP